jgi:hypothetical protein
VENMFLIVVKGGFDFNSRAIYIQKKSEYFLLLSCFTTFHIAFRLDSIEIMFAAAQTQS